MWKKAYEQFRIFGEWVFFGSIVGIVVGLIGILFHFGIEIAGLHTLIYYGYCLLAES